MLVEMEWQVRVMKKNLKETQNRKKSYADRNNFFKEFKVGEHVYLRLNPKNISLRIGSCAKLAP